MGSRNNKPGRIVKGTALQPTLKSASGVWSLDEAMQAHRANAWPQPDLLQPVAKSLKFKWVSGGGTGLYRYGMRGGDQRKFTLSTWFKKGIRSGVDDQGFLSANWGTSYASLHIATNQSNEGIQIYDWGSGLGGTFSISTIPVFRDSSAWYHLVVAVDTTQTIAFNRIKIWVNGVQITDITNQNGWNTADGGFPSLGYATPVNKPGGLMTVGVSASNDTILSSKTFDGQLAEYNFIDGAALTPTFFGTTTSTGVWIPKPYTGSYGSNGFYLPFDNATTSQTLGYDASVNGTTTYDADQDPYRGSVALHLTGNGPAGGNNNVFADSSPNNISIVRSGSATQGSFSPFLIQDHAPYNPAVHGASAYFGTSNTDNVYAASNTALNILTNNFTVEFWVNWTAWTGEQRIILMGQSGSSAIEIGRGTGSDILQVYTNTSLKISYPWSPAVGAWHHIAVVRTGTGSGQLVLYINGVNVATGTSADSISNNNFFVGGLNWAAGYNTQGHISNVRVINGTAVYNSNFTPVMRPFGTLTNNLLTFSEEFSNSYWTAQSAVVGLTTNAAIAPDGTPSATLLVPSTSSAGQNIAGLHDSAAGVNTFSIFAKSAGYRYIQCFHSRSAGGDSGYVTFDLTTGTVTNSSVWSGSVVDVGNGWYRLIATTSSLAGASANSNVRWAFTDGSASRAPVFTGNGTSGIYVWGAQAELASSVGNYTPTPANFRTAPALLLNFANAAVVDSAGAQNFTTVSNATISSSSKYGSGALTFNGTSDYLQSPAVGLNAFGASDFTIEAWISFNSVAAGQLVSAGTGGQTNAYYWQYYSSQLQFGVQAVGSVTVVNWTPTANTWYHVCVMRQGTNYYQFINGQQVSVASYTQTWVDGPTYIGYGGAGYFNGKMDDVRITRGVARYSFSGFTPPERALPEIGGDSFVTRNINAGVVRTFTTNNVNVVGAKIYHVTTAARSANYSVQYSDNNIDWTTAFGGVMSSMDGTVGIKVGTVTSGGSGTTGTGVWGAHLYWRYVEGSAISGHHPRCSRIIFTDINGRDYNFKVFCIDRADDVGEYQIGTKSGPLQGLTTTTSWTAPQDVTSVEVLVVGGGGSGGANNGAGGGAGGLIYNNAYPVTPGQTYTVTVGAGGLIQAGSTGVTGLVGANSQFGALIAIGGGGGAGGNIGGTIIGGSGGGACRTTSGGAGTAGQGFAGAGSVRVSGEGGGGGGAGGVGLAGDGSSRGGNGGAGLQFGITGTPTYYAGGGGGGAEGAGLRAGAGGLGGGGAGGNAATATAAPGWNGYTFPSGTFTNYGQDATPNTGGGGGGEASGPALAATGFGGNGIVILRYTTATETSSPTEDSIVDSPTSYGHDMQLGGEVIGNYCTLNPLTNTKVSNIGTIGEGNLLFSGVLNQRPYVNGTMFVSTGKWYFEVTVGTFGNSGDNKSIGITNIAVNAATNATFISTTSGYHRTFTNAFTNDLTYNDGAGTATHQLVGANFWSTDNTTYGLAIDIDNNTMSLYKNGALAYTKTNAGLSGSSWTVYNELESSSSRTPSTNWRYNFGQRPWIYTPPAGYNAWNTKNLPRISAAAALNPNQYFDTATYTGTGSYPLTVSGLNFQPDLIWVKDRNSSGFHRLFDRVRGATSSPSIYSNATSVEGADNVSFTSNGFTYSSEPYGGGMNLIGNSHVVWGWRAGGAPVSNTAGTITSSVSANTTSGFSVVTWSGNNTNSATIGHGLSTAPQMFIIKSRNTNANWYVWHTGLTGATYGLTLNATDAEAVFNFGTATVGATTITAVQGANGLANINGSATNYVGYFWTEVAGFSKFGTYTANGSSDGPFIHCGFKPRFILIKAKSSTSQWVMIDTARDPYNSAVGRRSIFANGATAEENGNTSELFDIVSNGFKLRSNGRVNVNGVTHIFMAFAENPFKGANAESPAISTRTPVASVFGYTGADQTYVVPSGVSRIRVAAWGAGGSAGTPTTGGSLSGNGGGAGSVEGFLDVVPGETLTIKVGQGVDALAGTVGNGTNTGAVLAASIYGGGGVNGTGDGAGSNAGTAGAGGGASSIIRASTTTTLLVAAGGGGAAGAGYTGSNPSANGGAGGAGAGTGGTGRGTLGTFTSGAGTYAGYPGTGGGGGGGGGGSGSSASVGNGDPGVGGSNTVPNSCTGYSGSTRTPGNTSSAYWDGTSGFGGIAPVAGGSITTSDGRIVIIG